MNFEEPPRREPPESVVPMINVVFLLLIFFLMTAQIVPPEPFEVEPPDSVEAEPGAAALVLQVAETGETAFGEARGETALAAVAAEAAGEPVAVRAHAALPADELARVLASLAGHGVEAIELATAAP
jgi:biopolymer transport protein ExbD